MPWGESYPCGCNWADGELYDCYHHQDQRKELEQAEKKIEQLKEILTLAEQAVHELNETADYLGMAIEGYTLYSDAQTVKDEAEKTAYTLKAKIEELKENR